MPRKGFTLVELLVIFGVMLILLVFAFPAYRIFQRESDLTNTAEEMLNTLRVTQNKTLASEGAAQYGVYFDQSTTPHQYILFQGQSYASRDSSFDEVHQLPSSLEISDLALAGGASEVVFERLSGETSQSGTITLQLRTDPTKTESIYIESSGRIDLLSPSAPSDEERIKDSRHVHFTYNQDARDAVILHLVFPDYPADNFDIDFQAYLDPGKTKFFWQGSVLVGPAGNKTEQQLLIQTHSLDLAVAQFSVHRDRRYNDKQLHITLDDQNLIQYAADGQTQKGTSIHVTDPEWQ